MSISNVDGTNSRRSKRHGENYIGLPPAIHRALHSIVKSMLKLDHEHDDHGGQEKWTELMTRSTETRETVQEVLLTAAQLFDLYCRQLNLVERKWRDATVLAAVTSLATNRSASPQARVFAVRYLITRIQPYLVYSYGALTKGNPTTTDTDEMSFTNDGLFGADGFGAWQPHWDAASRRLREPNYADALRAQGRTQHPRNCS
jgi:hypothetical protein